ncbi:MAG: MFS transporter [Gammaproteobacteria bacterium]|nr:MFS transporter [Gammaproteobacteria bacterium]
MHDKTHLRLRWVMFSYVFTFAMLAYVQRSSVSVAAEDMLPALNLSVVQLGWLNAAFTTAYAIFQLPGGALGQKYGARPLFLAVGVTGLIATIGTPIFPALLGGTTLFVALLATQFLLGFGQAPVFPTLATLVERWFPVSQFGLTNGLSTSGMLLGGALTAPLIVWLTSLWGWQGALLWTALPAAVLTVVWTLDGRSTPAEHPRIRKEELAELDATAVAEPLTFTRLWRVARNRNILLLALSYLSFNYVFYLITFWSFLYLVRDRGFSGLESGFMAMLPWLGAAVGAAIGGFMSDRLAQRMGPTKGYRLLPLLTLPIAVVMLLATPAVEGAYVAVAALVVAFFAMEINEGPFWAATMSVARADTGAATGVLNTGGNIGGIICQPIAAALAATGAWTQVWLSGAVFALLAVVLWLFVNAEPAEQ